MSTLEDHRSSVVGRRSSKTGGPVFVKTLADRRAALGWWSLGLLALVLMTVGLWPVVLENMATFNQMMQQMPPQFMMLFTGGELELTTAIGYLKVRLFTFMLPLLLLIYAVGFGANEIAGEEEKRTMELLLAQPVSRTHVVLAKFGALVGTVVVLAVVLVVMLLIGTRLFGISVSAGHLAAQVLMLVLLALVYGTLALALGSLTGRRGLALGVATAMAMTDYLLNSFRALTPSLDFLEPILIFHYYNDADPLRTGLPLGNALVLLLVVLLLLGLALWGFNRRDLRL